MVRKLRKISILGIYFTIVTISLPLSSQAVDLEKEKKALEIIEDFANKICIEVNQKGGSQSVELSANTKMGLRGVIKKLIGLGVEGAAKYKSEKYEGLLHADLLSAIKASQTCKEKIWNDLKERLLPVYRTGTRHNTTRPKGPSQELGVHVSILHDDHLIQDHTSSFNVGYDLVKHGKMTVISPSVGYLGEIEKGGPLDERIGGAFRWEFPTLDIKIVNNTNRTVFVNEAILDIERSCLDPTPILQVLKDPWKWGNPLHIRIRNEGWGAASNVKINFNIDPNVKDRVPDFCSPCQHSVFVGIINEEVNVDIAASFESAGVKLEELAALMKAKDAGGRSESSSRDQIREDFERKRNTLLGPFIDNRGLVSGNILYDFLTPDGKKKNMTLQFSTVVPISDTGCECGGGYEPPSYEYTTRFEVDGKKYSRRVNMSQKIKPGETDRFTLKIGANKSSMHKFGIRLIYNGSRIIQAGHFKLAFFVPKSDAQYLALKEGVHAKYRDEP